MASLTPGILLKLHFNGVSYTRNPPPNNEYQHTRHWRPPLPSPPGIYSPISKGINLIRQYQVEITASRVSSCKGRTRQALAPGENTNNINEPTKTCEKPQRFSSPSMKQQRPTSAGKKTTVERDPSPAGKAKRSSSPVPSKCVVPSLVAAKEENRKAAKEPAIIVPSRYRQPSPNARKASPCSRKMSMSPARRLSGGVKVSQGTDSSNKKKMTTSGSEIGSSIKSTGSSTKSTGSSSKSSRKNWDETPGASETKEKSVSKSKVDLQAILKTQAALSRRLSDAHSQDDFPTIEKVKASLCETPAMVDKTALGITLHEKKWTDGSEPLDAVSLNIAKLGQDAMQRRNLASIAAAEALQESLVTEALLRSLSMFSNLCSMSKAINPLPTIDSFMSVYNEAVKASTTAESIATNRTMVQDHTKSIALWVEAALATDLEVVSLLSKQGFESPSQPETIKSHNIHLQKQSLPETIRSHLMNSNCKSSFSGSWIKGNGINESVELGMVLQKEMQTWFLKFVEESLDAGFQVFGKNSVNNSSEVGPIKVILSQLKRVNDWLDQMVSKQDEALTKAVDWLKGKIYRFVIQHVGTTYDNSS